MACLDGFAGRYGVVELRARHYGNGQDVGACLADRTVKRVHRIALQVAVQDQVVVFAFQHGAESQQ